MDEDTWRRRADNPRHLGPEVQNGGGMFLVTLALDAGSGLDILYIMLFGFATLAVFVTHWNCADHEHSSLPHY